MLRYADNITFFTEGKNNLEEFIMKVEMKNEKSG